MDQMKHITIDEKILTNFSYKFHVIVKTLLHIGVGISKSSEFEDILEDLEEKLADTFFKLQLSESHVDSFFNALVKMFDPLLNTLSITRHRTRFSKTWHRFIEGIRQCVIHMYLVMEGGDTSKSKGQQLTSSK